MIQRPGLCLADGEAILWQKWDQDVSLLAASPLSSLLTYHAPKHFPKRAFLSQLLLSESGEGVLTIHWDLCPWVFGRGRNGHFAACFPLPLPLHPSLPSFHAFVCEELQFSTVWTISHYPCQSLLFPPLSSKTKYFCIVILSTTSWQTKILRAHSGQYLLFMKVLLCHLVNVGNV